MSMGLAYGGQGFAKGMEMSRQHRRQDRQDEQQETLYGLRTDQMRADMAHNEKMRPLQREQAEVGLQSTRADMEHQEAMRPIEREAAQYGLRDAERQDEAGEMELEAQRRSQEMQKILRRFAAGDVGAVVDWHNRYAENNITELGRTQDGQYHVTYDDGDDEILTRDELGQRMAVMLSPEAWLEEMAGGGEPAEQRWHEASDGALYDRRSGNTMTREEAGLPPLPNEQDQRDRKIRDLMNQGVERARAEDIVDGRERIIQHPVSGQTMRYNARTEETHPVDFPGDAPHMLPESERGGMLDEPLEVGFVPWLAELGSRTGGQFSDRLNNEDLERARTDMRMLREEFIEALAKSGRPPVVEQQRILESFPSLGPMESPERARASLQAVADSLVRIRNDDLRYSQDHSAPARDRGEARERARAIDRMLRRLDPSLFQQDDGPSPGRQGIGGGSAGAPGVGGPEAIQGMGAQELQQLDPANMTEEELDAAARRWEAINDGR